MRNIIATANALVGLLALIPELAAQDNREVAAPAPRFFDRPLDYWARGLSYSTPSPSAGGDGALTKSIQHSQRSDWTQVVRQPDGSYASYALPKPLVDVLEDPSVERIKAYFEWKLGRTWKILRAAEAMKEYRSGLTHGERPGTPPAAPSPSPANPVASMESTRTARAEVPAPEVGQEFTVKYFHRAGCRPCDTQDTVLSGWLKKKPGATLEVLDFGNQPDLWRRYNIRGTPSLVIEDKPSGKAILLEGLSSEKVLEEACLRLIRRQGDR